MACCRSVLGHAAKRHGKTAQLYRDIRAFADRVDRCAPRIEAFGQLSAIAGNVERRTAMVENDLLIGKRFCQLPHIAELRLEQPGIESQSVFGISGKAGAKGIRTIKTFRRVKRRSEYLCTGLTASPSVRSAWPLIAAQGR